MSEIFVSYARSTAKQAQAVAEALRAAGYTVWRDDELPSHRTYADVIEEQLQSAKAVVVIWSAEAVKSQWVRSEADRARAENKLVQLTVDGTRLPMPFDQIQCADLADWAGDPEAPGWLKVAASVAALTADPGPSRSRDAAPPAAPKLSICVLPFANMSGDIEQEYFSDGISEDIITDLSKVSALSVVARNTAFTFKGKALDIPEVARQLKVSHILEGSVRKAGNRVRITAQLIDGGGGHHVWAERYDRDLDDIFALQDEISEAIVIALRLKLLPEEKRAIERRGTDNTEAYDLYLMARQHDLASKVGDIRQVETVLALCQAAIEIDPNYARAWAKKAYAQMALRFTFERPGDDGLVAAERAIQLDPDLAEAHAVKARYLTEGDRREEAEAEIQLALRLDPGSYEVNREAGVMSLRQHRYEEAVRYYEKAVAANDLEVGCNGMLITCYTAIGDTTSLHRVARTTLGRAEKVLEQDQSNGTAMGFVVNALAALGRPSGPGPGFGGRCCRIPTI